jgi:hypothetical protein
MLEWSNERVDSELGEVAAAYARLAPHRSKLPRLAPTADISTAS